MADEIKERDPDTDDLLAEARKAFERCSDAEADNRKTALEDIEFARKGEQWPAHIVKQREMEGRPCLTINKMPAFIRQVVNDARQNKPAIKVHPADSGADPETAEIMNGLIRNIEYTSSADVAYDTAVECAVTGGFGYIRVGLDYAYDDSFDMDITINRVSNPFSVYGDPNSTAADSSDWDVAFVVDRLSKSQFETEYKGRQKVDWDDTAWKEAGTDWLSENSVMVAEWWTREKVDRKILMFTDKRDGSLHTYDAEAFATDEDLQQLLSLDLLEFKQERMAKSCKVKQRIMSGVEILKTTDWVGRYIPIIPVYGDEFDIEGKRYFRSMIHNAVDAQRMFNYWRTASTELIALAPKVPFIGPKGAFDSDIERWNTANTKSHPFLEFDGQLPPARQPLDSGVAAGAIQEALNASDDMKSIIGIYDASLGARSNETSGKAILARQREGDVSTFHFIDNMARAIRHTGRVIIDLIPKVYDTPRVVRVIGEDGKQEAKQVNQQAPKLDPKTGQPMQEPVIGPDGQPVPGPDGNPLMRPIMAMHDLTAGKYDLTVTTGPSFTTRREEAAASMTEALRAFPQAAPVIVPELAKNLDWPGADDIAEKLENMNSGQVPPELQKAIEDGKQQIEQLTKENQNLKLDQQANAEKIQFEEQRAAAEIQSRERIEEMKIASEERIAARRIQADAEVAAMRARLTADAQAQRPMNTNSRQPA